MKTPGHESDTVHIPLELLAEARRAAEEEQRPADELVSDALRRYLQEREHAGAAPRKNLAQLLRESPFAGANLDLIRRKEYSRAPEL